MVIARAPAVLATSFSVLMVGVNSIILLVLLELLDCCSFPRNIYNPKCNCKTGTGVMTMTANEKWFVSHCFVHRQFLTPMLGIEAAGKS